MFELKTALHSGRMYDDMYDDNLFSIRGEIF